MLLDCRHIRFKYPGSESWIFSDLSLRLDQPGFHALFGPSGVGKTSLARLIAGMLPGFSGQLVTEQLEPRLYSYNLERLPGWSSVGRHLDRMTPAPHVQRRQTLIEAFDLTGCMDRRFSQLSLGQQNRVNLLRYLLQDFQLLIMDESLANVDEKTRGRILLTIKEMFPEACFLYISHNVVEVARFCRRILVCRSPEKSPQVTWADGCDETRNDPATPDALEKAMLEVMHAG